LWLVPKAGIFCGHSFPWKVVHVRKIARLRVVLRLGLAPLSGSQERELTKYYLGQGNDFLGLWMKLLHNVNMSGGTSGGVQMYHDFLVHSMGVAVCRWMFKLLGSLL